MLELESRSPNSSQYFSPSLSINYLYFQNNTAIHNYKILQVYSTNF